MTTPPHETSEPGALSPPPPESPSPRRPGTILRRTRAVMIGALVVGSVAVITAGIAKVASPPGSGSGPAENSSSPAIGTFSQHHVVIALPARPASYLGVFVRGVPGSYAPVESFAAKTGVRPNLTLYYSGWYEKFRSVFAVEATHNGAVPFIQIEPSGVNLAAIVAGVYDTNLERFATDVANYGAQTGHGVIIGFGHEMNGHWYSWGYRHTAPALFVAAWRHIVNVFRQQGADDVTWLWTVNVINTQGGIPSPAPWWPGDSYVTWVGIDGYYYKPSWGFASLFGPTIKALRALTLAPILIAETGAAPAAGQPAKIGDLFAGIRAYGLLGFVWFDANGVRNWSLSSPAAVAAFRQAAEAYRRTGS